MIISHMNETAKIHKIEQKFLNLMSIKLRRNVINGIYIAQFYKIMSKR